MDRFFQDAQLNAKCLFRKWDNKKYKGGFGTIQYKVSKRDMH